MKLSEFIRELKNISYQVEDPGKIEIQMADCIQVVGPIFKDGTVYITDIDPDVQDDGVVKKPKKKSPDRWTRNCKLATLRKSNTKN